MKKLSTALLVTFAVLVFVLYAEVKLGVIVPGLRTGFYVCLAVINGIIAIVTFIIMYGHSKKAE